MHRPTGPRLGSTPEGPPTAWCPSLGGGSRHPRTRGRCTSATRSTPRPGRCSLCRRPPEACSQPPGPLQVGSRCHPRRARLRSQARPGHRTHRHACRRHSPRTWPPAEACRNHHTRCQSPAGGWDKGPTSDFGARGQGGGASCDAVGRHSGHAHITRGLGTPARPSTGTRDGTDTTGGSMDRRVSCEEGVGERTMPRPPRPPKPRPP